MSRQQDAYVHTDSQASPTVNAGWDRDPEATARAWDAIASGFDAYVTPTGDWALPQEALRHAALDRGMRFLDVASGSGALSVPAARLGAHVTAVDISRTMIERLETRARAEGLKDVEGHVMDGHALRFENDVFDVAGSQFGVMLFPDLPRALGELVRVTKPGGRVFLTAFRSPDRVEFLTFFLGAMQRVVPGFKGLPRDPPPLPFQVADADVLRARLEDAGLEDVRIIRSEERIEYDSGEHMWNWLTHSNPIAVMLTSGLTEGQKEAVRNELDSKLRERAGTNASAVLIAPVHIGIGTKP